MGYGRLRSLGCAGRVLAELGGLTAAQGLSFIRALGGLNIIAADINTVSPPHDVAELTASLAAQLAFELLFALPTKGRAL